MSITSEMSITVKHVHAMGCTFLYLVFILHKGYHEVQNTSPNRGRCSLISGPDKTGYPTVCQVGVCKPGLDCSQGVSGHDVPTRTLLKV